MHVSKVQGCPSLQSASVSQQAGLATVPTQLPAWQADSRVQSSASSHAVPLAIGSLQLPVASLHVSSVQGFPSALQVLAGCEHLFSMHVSKVQGCPSLQSASSSQQSDDCCVPLHVPAWQLDSSVHTSPSSHAVPSAIGSLQLPVALLHLSSVQGLPSALQVLGGYTHFCSMHLLNVHLSPSMHCASSSHSQFSQPGAAQSAVPLHTPPLHASSTVHLLPSLHPIPSALGFGTHASSPSLHSPCLHCVSTAEQSRAPPAWHAPAWQESPTEQYSPSSQGAPSASLGPLHLPLTHASGPVQSSPSLQATPLSELCWQLPFTHWSSVHTFWSSQSAADLQHGDLGVP